jgi:type 1 glutamine amidotransferase
MRILSLALFLFASFAFSAEPMRTKKVVLIAGPLDGGHPAGTHEYEKTVRMFKHCLDNASNVKGLRVEAHLRGWPEKASTLDDADTIVLVASGSDRKLTDHPFLVGDRLAVIEKQMKRGCGLCFIHWSTFVPKEKAGDKVLEWIGGYFDYESGPAKNGWYSKIQTVTVPAVPGKHPITTGMDKFEIKDEFYYNLRFRERDPRLVPILSVPMAKEGEHTVAWAVERKDGGRGFGFTGGHFFENWRNENYRRMALNAILWTAKVDVPEGGVKSEFPGEREIGLVVVGNPSQVLILTGHDGPFHNWQEVSQMLKVTLERDSRLRCRIVTDPEFLAREDLLAYDLIVQNYVNWERKGISDEAKKNLLKYLDSGRGLAVIHFANGAFHPSLPKADGDWPEYRKIVRRVWDHGKGLSGHDAYGPFTVNIAPTKHPITEGMTDFDALDELYYRQQGDETLPPLVTAKSKDTKKDEPLAWAYDYGKARVFQTVLGHSAESIKKPGVATLIRRGSAWAAKRDLRPETPRKNVVPKLTFADGKFGKALDARQLPASIEGDDRYRKAPLTIECWTKLNSKTGFNVLVSVDPKSSAQHWELYSYAGSGVFSAFLPGTVQGEIKSSTDICDGKWHHVAMTTDSKTVKLFVDGKQVKEQAIAYRPEMKPVPGPLVLGGAYIAEQHIGCDGFVDEVRISNIVRNFTAAPDAALTRDANTIGLWSLNGDEGISADANWTPPTPQANAEPWQLETDKDWVDGRFSLTDTGPFQNATIDVNSLTGKVRAYKGTAIKLGEKGDAAILFDRSTLQMYAGWTGGFLNHSSRRFGLLNTPTPAPAASMIFNNPVGPGWADSSGKFDVGEIKSTGPLPSGWAHYNGLYVNGSRIVLSYTVNGVEVLDAPEEKTIDGVRCLVRTIRVGPTLAPLTLAAGQLPTPVDTIGRRKDVQMVDSNLPKKGSALIAVKGDRTESSLQANRDEVRVELVASTNPRVFQLIYARGELSQVDFRDALESLPAPVDPTALTKAGPARWTKSITTQLELGKESGSFALDTFNLPYDNPYKSLFYVAGVDFMPSGEIAICTAHGDVWLAKGDFTKAGTITWKRYATGLYQALGLKVVEGKIVIVERGQLTRLHDTNNDGEADFYENVNSAWHTGGGEHSYDTCLETDPEGNFYFFKTGDDHTPTGGCLLKVSKDGKKMEIFSTGFRHPIGLGMSPKGVVSGADQEGNYMPSTRLDLYKKGGFYGDLRTHHRSPPPTTYDEPYLWLPKEIDNSAGGQVWVPENTWGALGGKMIHFSYGRCKAYAVLNDGDKFQGAITDLGLKFLSGSARARFNPKDGHMYVVGLDGWQTAAQKDGSLQRVRHTGKPFAMPVGFTVKDGGIELAFDQPLDSKAGSVDQYKVERWNYQWSANYGSKDWSLDNPKKEGRDNVSIQAVTISADRKRVFLKLPDVRPAMQMKISYDVTGASGQSLKGTTYTTIHGK